MCCLYSINTPVYRVYELNAAALDWGPTELRLDTRSWLWVIQDTQDNRVSESLPLLEGERELDSKREREKKKRLINKFSSLKVTKLLSWWYVLRLKGLSCRCGPAGQRTQHATTCRALTVYSPPPPFLTLSPHNLSTCSMPLPLCGVSLSRVETANRRFTCFFIYNTLFFFLSLSLVLPFSHADFIFIDAGQREGSGDYKDHHWI